MDSDALRKRFKTAKKEDFADLKRDFEFWLMHARKNHFDAQQMAQEYDRYVARTGVD